MGREALRWSLLSEVIQWRIGNEVGRYVLRHNIKDIDVIIGLKNQEAAQPTTPEGPQRGKKAVCGHVLQKQAQG